MADSNTKSNSQNAAHLLAILGWLVIFIGTVIVGSVMVVNHMAKESEHVNPGFWPTITFAFCIGIAFLVTAKNLKSHHRWARYVASFLSIVSLAAFPVGTVMGLFILSYLHKGWHEK